MRAFSALRSYIGMGFRWPGLAKKISYAVALFVFVAVGVVVLWAGQARAEDPLPTPAEPNGMSGTGHTIDPFVVTSCEELQDIDINTGYFYYILGNDIDCSVTTTWNGGNGFRPIGGDGGFYGSLDGKGHTISNLYLNCQSTINAESIGLFGYLDDNASITNLKIVNAQYDVVGCPTVHRVGGVAAYVYGAISDVSYDGDILVDCVNISGSPLLSGGIVGGLNDGRVTRSSTTGSMQIQGGDCGYQRSGGLAGEFNKYSNDSYIRDSYSKMNIIITSDTVEDCSNLCIMSGGLVGANNTNVGAAIIDSYAAGSIALTASPRMNLSYAIGGIVGSTSQIQQEFINVFTKTFLNGPGFCDESTCGPYPRVVSAVAGYDQNEYLQNDYSSVYFDQTAVGVAGCDSYPTNDISSCNPVNTDGGQASYFTNNSTSAPLNAWDFDAVWQTTAGLPDLRAVTGQYPDTPQNVTSTVLSTNTIQLNWDPPTDTGSANLAATPILTIRIGESAEWNRVVFADFSVEGQAIIYGLPASTQIVARISLVNLDGYWGADAETIATTARPGFHLIYSCTDLQSMQDDLTANYELAKNIDCSDTVNWNDGDGFIPIGELRFSQNVFSGIFDGNNYEIRDIYIDQTGVSDCDGAGIFRMTGQGLLQDTTIVRPIIKGGDCGGVGTLSGIDVNSNIVNVHVVDAEITTNKSAAGGFIGLGYGLYSSYDAEVSRNSFIGSITVNQEYGDAYGGLYGLTYGPPGKTLDIHDNYVDVSMNFTGSSAVTAGGAFGGLIAYGGNIQVSNTYATGIMTANFSENSGDTMIIGGLFAVGYAVGSGDLLVSDTFSHTELGDMNYPPTYLGGLGVTLGEVDTYPAIFTNNYYDADRIGTTSCSVFGVADCTAITGNPNYFYNNTTSPPLDVWDFDSIWQTTSTLPVFKESTINAQTAISAERLNRTDNTLNWGGGAEPGNPTGDDTGSGFVIGEQLGVATPGALEIGRGDSKLPNQSFIDQVTEKFKEFVRKLPEGVVRSFPYVLFGLVMLGIIAMLIEAGRQTKRLEALQGIIRKQRSIAQQRDTFWHLAANYLRAPVTLLVGGAEMLLLGKRKTAPAQDISSQVNSIQSKVANIMKEIESSKTLRDIAWPKQSAPTGVLRSAGFWIPIVSVAGLVVFANYVASSFRKLDLGAVAYLTQAMVFILIAYGLYWALTAFRGVKSKVGQAESMVTKQTLALSMARSGLVDQSIEMLSDEISSLREKVQALPASSAAREPMGEGAARLGKMLATFELLSAVEAGRYEELSPAGSSTSLDDVLSRVVQQEKELAQSKAVKLNLPASTNLTLLGSSRVSEQVIGSVLNNAISFSPQGGVVTVAVLTKPGMQGLSIEDQGSGVDDEQLSHMFEPFTKADGSDALKIDHEGLGVDLYLDGLIMDHLGGEIMAESGAGKGTKVFMWWPTH